MKKNLITIMICVYAVLSILCIRIACAEDQAHERQRNSTYEKTSGDSGQAMSAEIKVKVAGILSKYNASSLTAADAKAINNAFRAAGIKRGPGQKEAIEAAGFDPKKISELDPPPDRNDKTGSPSKQRNR